MTAAFPLVFPGSRTLAGWWKHLAPLQPRALWVSHLLLHRVEALAVIQRPSSLDPFLLLVLQAVALTPGETPERLDSRLHLGPPLLRQVLRQLEGERLVHSDGSGIWSLTPLGGQALDEGEYLRGRYERRAFTFVESEQPGRPPHFLDVANHLAPTPWPAGDGWHFDVDILRACVRRPVGWKERHRFPPEVEAIVTGEAAASALPAPPAWQRVLLDRPERLLAVLILAPAAGVGERLVGFAVQQEGWVVAAQPALDLAEGWQEVLPELTEEPPLNPWRQAWRTWCQPRALPAAEVDACALERHGCRLRVAAPSRLVELLRAARSDVLKGDAWLLAGTGRLRMAARVELVDAGRAGAGMAAPAGHCGG